MNASDARYRDAENGHPVELVQWQLERILPVAFSPNTRPREQR